jgi:hypothetical protein
MLNCPSQHANMHCLSQPSLAPRDSGSHMTGRCAALHGMRCNAMQCAARGLVAVAGASGAMLLEGWDGWRDGWIGR